MRIDVDKLLELEYLNSLVFQLSNEIQEVNTHFLESYDLEKLKKMDVESIKSLFNRYGVSSTYVLQFIQSDFIDHDWEYADLFYDDISYSMELREQASAKALEEVNLLNNEINIANENTKKNVSELENSLKLINAIIALLNNNGVILEDDINNLNFLLVNSSLTDSNKFNVSYNIVKYLIEKNKEILMKKTEVDTSEFEKLLDDAYASSEYEESLTEEKVDEPVYSETALGYYNYYKDLFLEEELGNTLAECMNTAYDLAKGVSVSIDSMPKEDFCIELAALLYELNDAQSKEKVDQDIVADLLMDLAILDRIYEEDSKHKDYKEKALEEIKIDLSIVATLDIDCLFSDRIKNRLSLLQIELKNNLINTKRKNEIISEYKNIKQDIKKLPEINKQINQLNKLKSKIVGLLSIRSLPSGYVTDDYYDNLSKLSTRVLELIDIVGEKGPTQDLTTQVTLIQTDVSKYTRVSNNDKKVDLKGFVLFDFDENNQVYVVSDLDPNNKHCLIDDSILKNKINNGYEDYCSLINDLLIYGTPSIMKDEVPPFINKILDNVFYKNRNHRTEMVRIRPLRNSMARFISQKVVLKPNTEIHRQVCEIIQEILPNVSIQQNEEFALYINFSSAIKESDTDSYDESVNRYYRKSPLYRLFIDNPGKTRLTEEECSLLKDIIHMSLNAYSELEKKNENMNFDIINQIGGKKTRG